MWRWIKILAVSVIVAWLGIQVVHLCVVLVQGPDWEVPLPNGYVLIHCNFSEIFIFVPEQDGKSVNVVVGPCIEKINWRGDVVFGYTESNDFLARNENYRDIVEGFFVLDTKTGNGLYGFVERGVAENVGDPRNQQRTEIARVVAVSENPCNPLNPC